MKRIFKYELDIVDTQTVDLPLNAMILSVIAQNDAIMLYAIVDDDEEDICRCTFRVIGTGNPFWAAGSCVYIGTVSIGQFVWHVFRQMVEI